MLAVSLIWKLIGWPCLLGVVTVIVAQITNTLFARLLVKRERSRRQATDIKLQKITQYVTAIRHLRFFALEGVWQDTIMKARQIELDLRVITSLWGIMINFTNNLSSGMFPVVAFWAYVSLAGRPLRVDVAFPALQLFSLLESSLREVPHLITVLLNAKVAVGRIEDFMSEPDKDDSSANGTNSSLGQTSDSFHDSVVQSNTGENRLILDNASFSWPGTSHLVLQDISIACPIGITLVCGKVGAGKTALLQALLGELDLRGGKSLRNRGAIAYCSQTPWLQSMSIRENILFFSPYDDARYRAVLQACALTQDLFTFKSGDLSEVGENGIGLSGGQKMRIALARAIYSRADIVLLDDPLSALDQQTAEEITQRCFAGPLLSGRTTVLVTHRVDVCRGIVKQIIEVREGKAHFLELGATNPEGPIQYNFSESIHMNGKSGSEGQNLNIVAEKFLQEEHRARGGVKAAVYWEYLKAGKIRWWVVLICILSVYRLLAVGEVWFLKQWGEAYGNRSAQSAAMKLLHHDVEISGLGRFFDKLPSPEANIKPWLYGFFLFAIAQAAMFLISQSFMLVIVYTAGRRMFQAILRSISGATFRFYDVTPLGRLMNRMTSDISTVDGNISQQFQDFAWLGITWVSSIVVIASVTPLFLVFSFALTAAFVLIFLRFLPTSQSLRRLEVCEHASQ